MANDTATPIEQRLASMAVSIRQLIPAAEVRLFGSRARGEARPDSDVDLLITAPDDWLALHDRFDLLGELWGAVAQPGLSADLVLHSCSEARRRAQQPGSVVDEAMRQGVLLHGQSWCFAVQVRYDDEPDDLSLDRTAWCNRAEALIDRVQGLIG
jgi:predicted nucleotidyltransferase